MMFLQGTWKNVHDLLRDMRLDGEATLNNVHVLMSLCPDVVWLHDRR